MKNISIVSFIVLISFSIAWYHHVCNKISGGDLKDVTENGSNDEVANTFRNLIAGETSEITRIAILGERHSGASWLASKLTVCFPEVEVTPSLSRESYWFQDSSIAPLTQPTLVLPIFLNAYDWVDRMRKRPIYAPYHKDMDWLTFVNAPWIMNHTDGQYKLPRNSQCQFNFNYDEVIPCNGVEINEITIDSPVYELMLNKPGEPYQSILDLRADKIRNFLSTAEWDKVSYFVPIKYENLVKANGFALILEMIKQQTGLTSTTCQTSGMDLFYDVPDKERISRSQNSDHILWMNENIDWDTEELVGYYPEPLNYEEILIDTPLANDEKIFNEDGTFNVESIESRPNDEANEISDDDEIEKYQSLLMGVPEVLDKDGTKVTHKTAINVNAVVAEDESNLMTEQNTAEPNWAPLHRRI